MRKIIFLIIGILIFSGFATGNITTIKETKEYVSIDDLSTIKHLSLMDSDFNKLISPEIQSSSRNYPIGDTIWQYTLSIYDPSPKAIAPIEDINGDGISDVIVCSEDDYVRCFDGGAIGTGNILWEHEIYAGDVYRQSGLDIIEDIDGDGYDDVVVGAAWGARLIRCISGDSGSTIWTHDTHEYGGGGWVYQVDCSYDYNGDGTIDVLAATGDDSSDTGPKRIYCLDGDDGISIWEYPLGGPGFSVIGVEDFTGDGQADVLAGCSNNAETIGYAKGINGNTGAQVWSKTVTGSSVWALKQIEDITSDGIKDVIVGDFFGSGIYGLDATDGSQEYITSIGSVIINRFAKLEDVNGNGFPDIVPAHSSTPTIQAIDSKDGSIIWSHSVADQPQKAAKISDISGDGIDDVLVGTLYSNNYCYFLDGTDGSELEVVSYGEAVDAINSIPDVVNDGSMEMVAGGRNGKVTCISGGLDAGVKPSIPIIYGPTSGAVNVPYTFYFVSYHPEGDDIYYMIDWDDGSPMNWIGPYPSGENATVSHTFTSAATYYIKAKANDSDGDESQWSEPYIITIVENDPPSDPIIDGETSGKTGVEYTYTFQSTDPNGDALYYYVDWGDGTPIVEWDGPHQSGDLASISHTFETQGIFIITAKAKDIYDEESGFSQLQVNMPRNKAIVKTNIFKFLHRFTEILNLIQSLRIK
jgi:hypothetical protein